MLEASNLRTILLDISLTWWIEDGQGSDEQELRFNTDGTLFCFHQGGAERVEGEWNLNAESECLEIYCGENVYEFPISTTQFPLKAKDSDHLLEARNEDDVVDGDADVDAAAGCLVPSVIPAIAAIKTELAETRADVAGLAKTMAILLKGQADLMEKVISADDSADIQLAQATITAQIQALSQAAIGLAADMAGIKASIMVSASIEELLEDLKDKIEAAENDGGWIDGSGDGDLEICPLEVNTFGNAQLTTPGGVGTVTGFAAWSSGFRAPSMAIENAGDYIEWIATGKAIVGLTPFPLGANSWRDTTVSWYHFNSYARNFAGSSFLTEDRLPWVPGQKVRLTLNDQGFIEWQVESGGHFKTVHTHDKRLAKQLFLFGMFGQAKVSVSNFTIGKLKTT